MYCIHLDTNHNFNKVLQTSRFIIHMNTNMTVNNKCDIFISITKYSFHLNKKIKGHVAQWLLGQLKHYQQGILLV